MAQCWDRVSNLCVCLVVPSLAGIVIGLLLILFSGSMDLTPRLQDMNAATDFKSLAGGCTITSSLYEQHTYRYDQPSCSSQCSSASACSDRYTHSFTVNADGTQHKSAPEDFLLSDTYRCVDASVPNGAQFTSAFSVGSTVPCWRAVDAGAVTRNENLPADPRYVSHGALNSCWRCHKKIGFACSGTQCITLVDPAAQVEYYTKAPDLIFPRNIAIAAGSAAALVFTCSMSYFAHRKSQEVDDDSSEEAQQGK